MARKNQRESRQQYRQRQQQQDRENRQLCSLGALVSSLASSGQFTPAAPPDLFAALVAYLNTLTGPSRPDKGSFPRGHWFETPALSPAHQEARDWSLEIVGIVEGEGLGSDEEMGEEEDEDEDEEMEEEDDDDDDNDDDEIEREMDPPCHYGAFYGD